MCEAAGSVSTQRVTAGLGIAQSIQARMRQAGGRARLHSAPGQGTRVSADRMAPASRRSAWRQSTSSPSSAGVLRMSTARTVWPAAIRPRTRFPPR